MWVEAHFATHCLKPGKTLAIEVNIPGAPLSPELFTTIPSIALTVPILWQWEWRLECK